MEGIDNIPKISVIIPVRNGAQMNKVKVLLIDPSGIFYDEIERSKPASPHLGLAYIRSFLKRECNAEIRIVEMSPSRFSVKDIKKIVTSYCPDLVGLTARTVNILAAYNVAKAIKEIQSKTIIVLGGAHGTALPALTLSECEHLNAVIRGEGEITMKEIVTRLSEGIHSDELFSGISGLTYRAQNGGIINEIERELIVELDILPFPDYSIYDLNLYNKVYNPLTHRFDMKFPILSSRGCPYQCTFCMPVLKRKVRYRSVLNVIQEIELMSQRYNARRLYFEDSTFAVNRKWFEEFCQEFTSRGLHRKMQWGFETRIELVQDEDIFKIAKEAGCSLIFFGIESGNEDVLHCAKKNFTKNQVRKAVQLAKAAGIDNVAGSFIFGLPCETKNTIEETIELIRELQLDVVNLNILDIYPGTELYDMVDRGVGGIRWLPGMRNNWSSYSRRSCQTVVNDLAEQDLIGGLNRAFQVGWLSREKVLSTNFAHQAIAFFLYYLKNDPKQLVKYGRNLFFRRWI